MERALDEPSPPCAIGEIGLDLHFRPRSSLPLQEQALRDQLALARERDLPLILHVVKAQAPLLRILKRDGLPKAGGVIHAFSGSLESASAYLTLGLYLGVAAPFVRSPKTRRALAAVPEGSLLLETDAPDQAPLGVKRGEPVGLIAVAQDLGKLRACPAQQLLGSSSRSTRALFGPFS